VAASGQDAGVLAGECAVAAVDRVLDDHELPWDAEAFAAVRRDVRSRAPEVAADALATAADVLAAARRVGDELERLIAPGVQSSVADARAHLARLVAPGFVLRAGTRRLPDVHRYVRGIEHRLLRLGDDVARDRRRMAEVVPLEDRFARHLRREGRSTPSAPEARELGWQLEELRMSLFAQSLGVGGAVSARRISRALDRLGAPPT
jgi:ATP-dependent helicase HrpA